MKRTSQTFVESTVHWKLRLMLLTYGKQFLILGGKRRPNLAPSDCGTFRAFFADDDPVANEVRRFWGNNFESSNIFKRKSKSQTAAAF